MMTKSRSPDDDGDISASFPLEYFLRSWAFVSRLVRAIMGTARVTRHNRVVHCTLYSLYSALYTRGPDSCTPPGQSFPVRDVTSIRRPVSVRSVVTIFRHLLTGFEPSARRRNKWNYWACRPGPPPASNVSNFPVFRAQAPSVACPSYSVILCRTGHHLWPDHLIDYQGFHFSHTKQHWQSILMLLSGILKSPMQVL